MQPPKKKFVAIVQARCASTRLPNKVLAQIGDKTLIQLLLERVKSCNLIDDIVIATTQNISDDKLTEHIEQLGFKVIRGSSENVLSRFCLVAEKIPASNYIRITGDCPLIDPFLISKTINFYLSDNFDYVSNSYPPSFADGLDIEVFTKDSLLKADAESFKSSHREHVTQWIRESGNFKIGLKKNIEDLSKSRWTVDEKEDLKVIRNIVEEIGRAHV